MDYQALAKEMLEMRIGMPLVKENRQLSRMVQGAVYVLNYLGVHDNTAYPKDISRGMSVSTARIAKILNHLEEKGYVIREKDPKDNRQTIVTLTEAGLAATHHQQREMLDRMAWILEQLGPEDAREYIRIQRKISECMKNAAK